MRKVFNDDMHSYNNYGINKLLLVLFFIAIVLIPFDNLPYMKSILGELGVRGPVYVFIPIIIIVLLYFILKRQIYFKLSAERILLGLFIIWTGISAIVNINNILANSFKERSGIEKFILQIMVIGFMVAIMYVTEFIINLNKITLSQVRKYVLISFFIVGAYSILEILRIYNIINVDEILMNTSYYIQKLNRGVLYGDRIRSVTGEASFLGMYIAFAYPWIVSYIFTEKKYTKKVLYALLVIYMLLLVYLTKSRSAYAVVMGEMGLTLFGILLFDKKKVNKILVVVVTICCAVSISGFNRLNDYIISLRQEENTEQIEVVDDGYNIDMSVGDVVQSLNSKTNHSNIARVGLQKSAVKMGISHPIFGVGLGQFGFYADEYIDESTRISNEIQNWMNPESVDYWPPAFALIPRIIGEQGIVGVSLFIGFILVTIFKFVFKYMKEKENTLEIFMAVSLVGVVVSTFNADTYALPHMWILFGIITYLANRPNEKKVM